MKRILKGLTALIICGALNFGLTTDAQAAELESQEVSRHHHHRPPPHYEPPPRHGAWGHRYPPPHYGDYYRGHYRDDWHRTPPPPHRMPPPPRHRW